VAKRPQTLRPGRGLAAQRVVAGREDVRTPATPVVALSASACPPCGRPSNRSSGRPVSRDRCHPGVRTDGPPVSAALPPRCPDRAGPWNGSVRRAVPVGAMGLTAAVVRGRRDRLPAWGLTGRDGVALAVGGSHEGRRQTWAAAPHAHRRRVSPRRLPTRELVQGQGAGRLAGGTRTPRCSPIPPQVRPGQVAGVVPDHRAGQRGGDHARWSLGW
jgi:hypothetical protein